MGKSLRKWFVPKGKTPTEFELKMMTYEKNGYPVPPRKLIKTPEQIEGIRRSGIVNTGVLDLIEKEIRAGMTSVPPWAVIPDRAQAIRLALKDATSGEIFLLCGKGHEKYDIRGTTKIPFDEKAIVLDAVQSYLGP